MAEYYPAELGTCLCRIAEAAERSADALETIAEEAVKQTATLAHIAEEHETQTWLMERIAVATECQCNCCTTGYWRSDALMEVSMGNPYNSAPERLEMYREKLKKTSPTTDGSAPDWVDGEDGEPEGEP